MLNLIFTLIMFGVKVDSCANLCDCEKLPEQSLSCDSDNNTDLNVDQQNFLNAFNSDNIVKFPDIYSVQIKTCELYLNFSEIDLKWIKKVSLSDNNLTTVPVFITDFIGMHSLDLSRNEIESIDAKLFRTLNLKRLNLSSNSFYQINTSEFANLKKLTSLDLSNNELSFLENLLLLPSLQYLNLSNNKLKVLNGAGFNSLKLLQHLDVSRNQLVRIAFESIRLPNLARLFVAGNTQLGKSRDVFVFVGTGRKLQSLDASLTGLKQVPAALTHSIQSLNLTENLIRTINCGDLDDYPLLYSLDLSFNEINFVEEDSLGRLEFLSVLYIARNRLVEIPRRLPEKLKVLHLDINEIGRITKKDLRGLTVLEVLLLNDNNITVINEGAFSELISLVTLDLSRNPLINLQSGSFAGPLSLETLRLSSIEIISTNEDNPFPLAVPERLVKLDLSRSPGLARQFLSDTATLMAAKRLQELDLSGGNLENLKQDLQFFLPQLKVLRIGGNKFNSTEISSLKSWLCKATTTQKPIKSNIFKANTFEQSELSGNIKSEPAAKNANEFDEFPVNEVYYGGVMSNFSQNLAGSYNKNTPAIQQRHNELVRSSPDERAVDKLPDSIKWNVSEGEISMYTSEKKNYFYRSLFLVLSSAFVVFAISVLIILRLIRIRQPYVEDFEATDLPTISDIW
ncbi:unnamed protein product [Psylliodes chrysocephalus]|uniref:Uncharacterized protein n=1 Tax=Psylliodes chrysocephalus TaxID=3402493 RepID=A0A9P0GCS1_9CUCU|nr:unnamed protein product [Psylliodes chrysocephala]